MDDAEGRRNRKVKSVTTDFTDFERRNDTDTANFKELLELQRRKRCRLRATHYHGHSPRGFHKAARSCRRRICVALPFEIRGKAVAVDVSAIPLRPSAAPRAATETT